MRLGDCYRLRVDSLRDLIEAFDEEIGGLEDLIHDLLKDHPGYRAVQAIDGVLWNQSMWASTCTGAGR